MSKLPTQLKWSEFETALRNLKNYKPLKSKGGSARHFQRLSDGEVITVHEPHGGDTLRQGTLSEYLRKLGVDRETFEAALYGKRVEPLAAEEERYRRIQDTDGAFISNCLKCYKPIGRFPSEDEMSAAEANHACWLNAEGPA